MKQLFFTCFIICIAHLGYAQETASEYISKARTFSNTGDFDNAALIINKGLEVMPNDIELQKEITYTYYLKRDFKAAMPFAKKLASRDDITEASTIKIIGLVFRDIEENKEFEKLYKKAFKNFPNSGILYSEYGEYMMYKKDPKCIESWEKGIKQDPNFSTNYYHAAKYYYNSNNLVWALLYAENFVNIESFTTRTAEIKQMVYELYKKIYTTVNFVQTYTVKGNEFINNYLACMQTALQSINNGITAESLLAVRTRFVLEWFEKYNSKHPYRLFLHFRELLKAGNFLGYNQWLLASVENLPAFQAWTESHKEEYNQFINGQRNRVYKIPEGQYYAAK
jgi:tetratricopeptide (TPR) repeat protein